MWQDKLKEIIYILENSDVNEIEIKYWGRKFRVVKNPGIITASEESSSVIQSSEPPEAKMKTDATSTASEPSPPKTDENTVLSPMPGTFYTASSPDDPPFVSTGDTVKKGQTLCIIEAMKIMNEIESECDGTITGILVNDSEPIEYNQPLFTINPV